MRTLSLLLLTAYGLFAGDTLSQHDRDFAMSHMHASRKVFLDAVAGLTPEQWNFKPGPDRWSVAQVMEHIAAAEDFIRVNLVQEKVMTLPAEDSSGFEVVFDCGLAGS